VQKVKKKKKKKKKTLLSPPSVPPALTRWGQLIIIVQWAVIAYPSFSVFVLS